MPQATTQTITAAQHRKTVIESLLNDHKRVQKIFKQVKKLGPDHDAQEYRSLL